MAGFNPLNERFKKQYEDALIHGSYREPRTVDAVWKAINLFEQSTGLKDFTTFNAEQAKSFKVWLIKQKNVKDVPLSLSTVRSTLGHVREFFRWLATHPQGIRKVDGSAVGYLRLSNNDERAGRATRESPPPTIEEVRQALQAMPVGNDIEKRNRAIMAFTALSGVRDAALISLKMKDVDLPKREIWQDPRHVRTKNRKGITTFFMPFDPLWEEIVVDWITYARDQLGMKDNDPLFPKERVENNPEKMKFESAGLSREHWANASAVRDIFKNAFLLAGVPYYRPHSFRKMLVIWAMDNCSQIQVKAISQNLGHEHAMTTYNSYGTLSQRDQHKAIQGIGKGKTELHDVPSDALLAEICKRTHK
ncbi:MAG: site-specific integrase [Alphaproteobacteria bacterium]|nr:site-specific integrase [Alphaproteobacteria bacterium]